MVNEFSIENDWAIILGGSSGLGLASAKKLAQHGMNICIVHRDTRAALPQLEVYFNSLRELGVQVITFNVDATRLDKREQVIKELLAKKIRVKCLVHSLARGNLKTLVDKENSLQNDDFHLTLDAMAISLYDWVHTIFKANIFSKKASIISFTSEGSSKAWKNYAAVSAAKSAIESITRSIALEFAPYGIRANCIQAGVTDTNSLRKMPNYKELMKVAEKRNPYARLTLPEDVANVVYLLCKKEADWINGTIIPVDGGEHIN